MSDLGYGCAGIGNHRLAMTDEQARALLDAAWENGIRHFDTAPHYGLGLSERRLGAFLATKPRDEYVVSTKVGRVLVDNPGGGDALDDEGFVVPAVTRRVWDFTEDGVRRGLAASLERLGLDRVDVVYLHDPERWDLDRGLGDGLPALAKLKAEGVTGQVGVGSMDTAALLAAARSGLVDVLMAAGRYTLADQSLAAETLPVCDAEGVAVVAAAVFNGGLLAAEPTRESTFDYAPVTGDVLDRARRTAAVCARFGVPLAAAALHFPLRHPAVVSVVAGGVESSQIAANAGYLATEPPEALWDALREEGLVTG
ncbi:aldo/keto reductase [Nocardioides speluncae]|uniref:aldo/keto reductase n=1 Tax=Nocardioides speluncae TaxID=2670337 RepID=UPI000D698513|nr:aldo/keto reductase [Nocardioides speluncae]